MPKQASILRFVVKATGNPMAIMSRFHPQGQIVLNRTEWRGKEPRSCAVTGVKGRPYVAGSKEPLVFDVEVTYRPKGTITYVGGTKYDGWTAMVLDRKGDGTLLDGHGNPLPEGQPPVYRPFEMFQDAEFNEIDFDEFAGESEVEGIRHLSRDEFMKQIAKARYIGGSMTTFMAPRKHRPLVKIVLSNAPSGTSADAFGTRLVLINNLTPQLRQVVLDEVTEAVGGFVEGRYSIKSVATEDLVFVEVSDLVVDCTPNEQGKDSRFHCLHEYVPDSFFEDLALRLMSIYEIDASVVDGPEGGLVLRRKAPSE